MSPSEFMDNYRALQVKLDDGQFVSVDVHSYMINQSGKHSTDKALGMWGKMRSRLQRDVAHDKPRKTEPVPSFGTWGDMLVKAAVGAMAPVAPAPHAEISPKKELHQLEHYVKRVPYGKGSPEEVAMFLRLAVRAGMTTPAKLQQFANDRYVGLDCSGFVSNYLVAIGKMKLAEVGEHNARSYASGHPKRMSMDSLNNLDILVWADGHHVAIMEEPEEDGDGTTATVVESNGRRGLDAETYTFLSVDRNGLFTVKRETGRADHRVHVFDWNLDV